MTTREQWLVLVDFDGTLTARDADLVIADAAGGAGARAVYTPLVEAYEGLRIGLVEFFTGYLVGLGLGAADLARHATAVPLRPGAGDLLAGCARAGLRVRVVSEGLDAYVLPLLAQVRAPGVEVSCNRLVEGPDGPRILPPPDGEPCARCLNCKGAHVRRGRTAGMRVALVGNGASDLCAARVADLVLARDTLAALCRAEGIPHVAWRDLAEVRAALGTAVAGDLGAALDCPSPPPRGAA